MRVTEKTRAINAIALSTTKREVESLKSEVRALRTGHTDCHGGEIAVDTLRKILRHEVLNGYAECDTGCEVCVKTRGI